MKYSATLNKRRGLKRSIPARCAGALGLSMRPQPPELFDNLVSEDKVCGLAFSAVALGVFEPGAVL